MARTKLTARKSAGGHVPRGPLAFWTTPRGTSRFLREFGMPSLLWRLLHVVGYPEGSEPLYRWTRTRMFEGSTFYSMGITVPAREDGDQLWQTRTFTAEGQEPWEGANTATYQVLLDILEDAPEEVTHVAEGVFPRGNSSHLVWVQPRKNALERGPAEAQHSDGTVASVVFAIMKAYACMQRNYNFMEDTFREFHHDRV